MLLDAAAFVPTNRLDLRLAAPDFVAISFYKMFGYPTGVGCLLIRHDALATLRRPWFAGGTVNFATVQGRGARPRRQRGGLRGRHAELPEHPGRRDRPPPSRSASASTRFRRASRCLTGWLLTELQALRHGNGRPVVRIYGPCDDARRAAGRSR